MTSAISAKKTFLIWDYEKILEILNISGPSQSRDLIDVTSHDSTFGFKEFVAGIISGGEVSIDGNFISGDERGQVAFHTDMQATTIKNAFIIMPMATGIAWFFTAFAKGFAAEHPMDSKVGVSGSLLISGQPLLLVTQAAGMSALEGIKDGGTGSGEGLTILPTRAVGTYDYACTVHTTNTGVKLTVTADSQIVYVHGELEETDVETDAITLGAAGTVTKILILVYDDADPIDTAPRLYTLSVTRPLP